MKAIKFTKKTLAVLALIVALKTGVDINPSVSELLSSTVLVLLSVFVLIDESLTKYY